MHNSHTQQKESGIVANTCYLFILLVFVVYSEKHGILQGGLVWYLTTDFMHLAKGL